MLSTRVTTPILLSLLILSAGSVCVSCASHALAPSGAQSASTPSAGPNSVLPPAQPASQGCAALDSLFSDVLINSSEGSAFVQAQARGARTDELAPSEEGDSAVQESWRAFIVSLKGQRMTEFRAAGGEDEDARMAVDALEDYIALAPDMLSGKIPQFLDEQAARHALETGQTPEVNPDYTRRANQLAEDIDALSRCMPTWPLIF